MKHFLGILSNKENLSLDESIAAFEILMNGKASDFEIFDFLTLLSEKGEVSDEIAGGVYVLRNKAKRVNVQNCVDTCGTGGDGAGQGTGSQGNATAGTANRGHGGGGGGAGQSGAPRNSAAGGSGVVIIRYLA